MKINLFILTICLYSNVAWSNACLDLYVESPLFQLTSTIVVGPTTLIDFKKINMGSVYLNPRVYLSPFDEEENHVSIGITPEKELYLVHSKSRTDLRELSTAWLLSGELKVESFEVTSFRFLSVTDIDGNVYTIDNALAEESLNNLGLLSIGDLIFGKSFSNTGLLKEVNSNNPEVLRRLDPRLFLSHIESD